MTHTHFAYGLVNPLMGFGFALAGSFLGLTCMVHARKLPSGPARRRWLMFASLAIGGTGIWMMHFIAMIGFTVSEGEVRYDVGITAASLVASIVSVAIGIFIVGSGKQSTAKVFLGGPITGLGVVAMHYAGMAAMNIAGTMHYDPIFVGASVAIAIIAATVALYFTISVSGKAALTLASVTMAIAVCGMHYTGMYAISVELNPNSGQVPGVDPLMLLIPILVLATGVLIALIVGVLGERDDAPPVRRKRLAEPEPAEPAGPPPSLWATDVDPHTSPETGNEPQAAARPSRTPVLGARLADRKGWPPPGRGSETDETSLWAASLRSDEDEPQRLRR